MNVAAARSPTVHRRQRALYQHEIWLQVRSFIGINCANSEVHFWKPLSYFIPEYWQMSAYRTTADSQSVRLNVVHGVSFQSHQSKALKEDWRQTLPRQPNTSDCGSCSLSSLLLHWFLWSKCGQPFNNSVVKHTLFRYDLCQCTIGTYSSDHCVESNKHGGSKGDWQIGTRSLV